MTIEVPDSSYHRRLEGPASDVPMQTNKQIVSL